MKLLSPVLFYISLTTRPIFLVPLCVALLRNWDFLTWLLRQSDIGAGLIGSSSEKAMRSATNMVVWALQICHWCFFNRLVFDGAVIFRVVLLLVDTSSPFFATIKTCNSALQLRCSTVVTKSDIGFGLVGSSFGKTMRSATNMVVWSLQLCHSFFLQVSNWWSSCLPSCFTSPWDLVPFFWAIVCSTAPQLRFSTLVTKTERYCCWTEGLLLRRPCVQLQTWLFDPFNFFIDVFYRLVFNGAVVFPVVLHLVDFFWGQQYV